MSEILLFYIVVWLICNVIVGTSAKEILTLLPYPITVSVLQLSSKMAYGVLTTRIKRLVKGKEDNNDSKDSKDNKSLTIWSITFLRDILLLGFVRLSAKLTGEIALLYVHVSFINTVSITSPIFTMILSYFLINERCTLNIIASVIPIILGVGLSSYTETATNIAGLLYSLSSTILFSLSNILTKKFLNKRHISEIDLAFYSDSTSVTLMIPFWIYFEMHQFLSFADTTVHVDTNQTHINPYIVLSNFSFIMMVFMNGFCTFLQTFLSFYLLSRVTSLSYAILGISKKTTVIVGSVLYFKNEVDFWNKLGICISIAGVIIYTLAVSRDKPEIRKLT